MVTLENALDVVETIANVQLKIILCVASQNLRYERLRNRAYQDSTIKIDVETTDDYLRLFKHLPPDKLILYTNDPLEKCLALAVDYLIS